MAAWTQHEDAEDRETWKNRAPHINRKVSYGYVLCRVVEEVIVHTGCPFAHSVRTGYIPVSSVSSVSCVALLSLFVWGSSHIPRDLPGVQLLPRGGSRSEDAFPKQFGPSLSTTPLSKEAPHHSWGLCSAELFDKRGAI